MKELVEIFHPNSMDRLSLSSLGPPFLKNVETVFLRVLKGPFTTCGTHLKMGKWRRVELAKLFEPRTSDYVFT